MKDITIERSDYTDVKPDYVLVRDTLRGESHMKSKTTTYVPKTSGQLQQEIENPVTGKAIYAAYLARAEFYDAVASAYRSMIAMAHSSQPEIDLPAGMKYLINEATDDGMPLEEFAKRVTREQLTTGRCPILTDAPTEGNPYLLNYRGEELINWLPERRYVFKLAKSVESETGEITAETYYVELLLSLTEGGDGETAGGEPIYTQTVWEAADKGAFVPASITVIPEMNKIPIVIAGSVDTTDEIDEIPLLPMSKAAVAAFQMSADYRHALFLCGQPTPYGTGVETEEKPTMLGSGTFLQARNPQAKFDYMEVTGAGLSAMEKAISSKKTEADMYGVRVIGAGAGEAAETLKVRLMAQQASLKSAVKSGGEAIEKALKNIAVWMGLDPDSVSYTPNLEFANVELDTNVVNVFNAAINAGNLPKEMLWEYMRAAGLTEDDDEAIQGKIEGAFEDDDEDDDEATEPDEIE